MAQLCSTGRPEHIPVIERYYDEEQPELVKRLFKCETCGTILGDDIINKAEEDYDHTQDFLPVETE